MPTTLIPLLHDTWYIHPSHPIHLGRGASTLTGRYSPTTIIIMKYLPDGFSSAIIRMIQSHHSFIAMIISFMDRAWLKSVLIWIMNRLHDSLQVILLLILADMVLGRRKNIDRNRAGLCGMIIKPSDSSTVRGWWLLWVCECVSVWLADWLTG